jgi:hypothetical protein
MATKPCFYGLKRRRPGDIFLLDGEHHFNPNRMERVAQETPLRESTSASHLRAQHDQLLASKMAGKALADPGRDDGPADLEDTGHSPLDD